MTQQTTSEQMHESSQRRSRGPGKPFPSITFEEAILLPKSILEHGFNGEIQRLTLLRQLEVSPSSSRTRGLISGSFKYGLTEGSYNAPSLSVTDAGRVISGSDQSSNAVKEKGFELAINQFGPFKGLYEQLKESRLRESPVIYDELRRFGVSEGDCQQAAEIFTANLRFLGLIEDVSGSEHVRSIEYVLRETPTGATDSLSDLPIDHSPAEETTAPVKENGTVSVASNRPALHIDIQVHIDPTSSAELIDQIFASMARHLYGLES